MIYRFQCKLNLKHVALDLVERIHYDISPNCVASKDFFVVFNQVFCKLIIRSLIEAGFSPSATTLIAKILSKRALQVLS